MNQDNGHVALTGIWKPGGIFVVHLRSGSDPRQRQLSGRIEHVMSGEIQRFDVLCEMLDFMAQHALLPESVSADMSSPVADHDNDPIDA